MASIRVISIGDRRVQTEELAPGIYDLMKDGQYVELGQCCVIDVCYQFKREYPDSKEPEWCCDGYLHDTLRVKPSRWQRLKSFVLRRPLIPKAITIVSGKP